MAATRVGNWEWAAKRWEDFTEHLEIVPHWFCSLVPFDWTEKALLQTVENASGDEGQVMRQPHCSREGLHATPSSHRMLHFEPLTRSEQDVVQELATGAPIVTIAANLFLSVNTVKFHLRSLYRKLHVSNREEAVRLCVQVGLS